MATTSDTAAGPAFGEGFSLPRINWGWFVFRGVLAILIGLIALFFPFSALFAFAMVFAVFMFVDGIAGLIAGIRGARAKEERWWALILSGLLGIAIGAIFILWPGLSTLGYALASLMLIAAWALLRGIFDIWAAIRLRKEIKGEWLLALSGLISIIFGLAIPILTAMFPGASLVSLAWVIGFYALVSGVALIALGFKLRKRQQAAD